MVTIIEPKSRKNIFREIKDFKDLFLIFIWRDIKVRYKRTFLGLGWILMQSAVTVFIFGLLFYKNNSIDQLPFFLYIFSGLVFWLFFSNSLTNAASSLVSNENIIKKVYFPKIILPLSAIAGSSIGFAINLAVLLGIIFFLGLAISVEVIMIFLWSVFLTILFATALSLILSLFFIKYKDVRFLTPFLIQISFFISPIFYSFNDLSLLTKNLFLLNPLTGIIIIFRNVLTTNIIYWDILLLTTLSVCIMLILGIYLFTKIEDSLMDII